MERKHTTHGTRDCIDRRELTLDRRELTLKIALNLKHFIAKIHQYASRNSYTVWYVLMYVLYDCLNSIASMTDYADCLLRCRYCVIYLDTHE